MNESQKSEFSIFIKQLADESAKVIMEYYRQPLNIEFKTDISPVTEADRAAEKKMRELILKKYPTHGIIGEELGEHQADAEYKWVLDPIDGTKTFISGTPLFGTLIALLKNGQPVLGAINLPVLNQFLIGDNHNCYLNGNPVKIRPVDSLEVATLLVTDPCHFEQYYPHFNFDVLTQKVNIYRTWGDCYGYYLLATGYADIMMDAVMSSWDIMALIPVIQGAGGKISDISGYNALDGNSIIAASANLHEQVIEILNTVKNQNYSVISF